MPNIIGNPTGKIIMNVVPDDGHGNPKEYRVNKSRWHILTMLRLSDADKAVFSAIERHLENDVRYKNVTVSDVVRHALHCCRHAHQKYAPGGCEFCDSRD